VQSSLVRRTTMTLIALLLAACATAPIPPAGAPATAGGTPESIARDIVAATNDARVRNGRARLDTSSRLMDAARIHAKQMAAFQRDEHTIPDARYPTMQSRLQAAGYVYSRAAENVAWNQPDARQVVNSWMNSPSHRTNILNPAFTQMGAAMARSTRGEPYWVQVFGTPQ
jgi:uncharacterized protein YkwD